MSSFQKIMLPLSQGQRCSLRAGQTVLLSGTVYSARDAAHKKLYDSILNGTPLPFDLENTAIYYVGACPAKPNEVIGSCGPTTASRMDAYTPALLSKGVKIMIGKGKRSPEVMKAIRENSAVYFAAIGGAGAYYADCILENALIAYPELLSEAVYKMVVRDFPVICAIDALGNSVYQAQK